MNEQDIVADLIAVNNDRITGYLTASEQFEDPRLKNLFAAKVAQSRLFVDQLRQKDPAVTSRGPAEATVRAGRLYETWTELRAFFTGTDKKAALESCEYGEDAALRIYDKALSLDMDLQLRSLLIEQENGLRQAHSEVRSMREQMKAKL